MGEILTSLVMGEIHNEDILVKELSDNSILFVSQQNLKDTEDIILKLYKLEESSYEQFKLENCKICKINTEKTHSVFRANIVNPCDRLMSVLYNIKQFSMQRQIQNGDYSGLDFLKTKKPIYPTEQDKNILDDFKAVTNEWFKIAINDKTNEQFKRIAEHKEIAFALNTRYLMQRCEENTYSDIYNETLKKYQLENHGLLKEGIQRVYIGNEFCQHIFPYDHILKYIKKAYDENYEVTVMLSFMDESMAGKILNAIDEIERYSLQNQKKIEIVVNDWGILNHIKKNTCMIIPVLGRLLNKRKKDPRKKWIWRDQNDETIQFSCLSNNDYFRKFINKYGIQRYEFEVYDDKEEVKSLILKGHMNSLHFPFYQMMTSLYCPLFSEYNHFAQNRLKVHNCPHVCTEIIRVYSRDLNMIGIGNSNFIYVKDVLYDADLLKNYCNSGVDRLVFSPVV